MAQEISDIAGVGPSTIKKINSAGAETLAELSEKTEEELIEAGVSDKKADRLIQAAKRNSVVIQTGSEVVDEYASKKSITTGMPVLDDAIGGGWEEGFIVALAGASGSAKTQMCFQALVSAVEETGDPAVFLETERSRYRPERLKELSTKEETQEKIHRIGAYDLDQQLNAIGAIRENYEDLSMVVVDSFTARFRLSDQFEDRGSLSQRSTTMGRHLVELEKAAEELQIPILITAQIYSNPGSYGASEYVYGGSLFQHTVSFFMYMSQGQGDLFEAEVKNHPGQEEQTLHIQVGDNELQAMRDD